MIPAWIIDELTRQQEERRREEDRQWDRLDLPMIQSPYPPNPDEDKPTSSGPIVIEF